MKNKRGAMEMSVGTIVTIVLLMSVLILGAILIMNIFTGAIRNVEDMDRAIKDKMNELFAVEADKKVFIYPTSKEIFIKKGKKAGFGLSIRNTNTKEETFSYTVSATEVSCPEDMTLSEADSLINLGKSGTNILIPPGSSLEDPIFVKYDISENVPPCDVRYNVQVYSTGNKAYAGIQVDLMIESK